MAEPNPRYQLYDEVENRPHDRGRGYPMQDLGRREVCGQVPFAFAACSVFFEHEVQRHDLFQFMTVVDYVRKLPHRTTLTFVCEGLFTTPTKTSYAMHEEFVTSCIALLPRRLLRYIKFLNLFAKEEGNPRPGLIGVDLALRLPPFLLKLFSTLKRRICP